MPRPGRKRLTVDIPILMHEQLKEMAQRLNVKMTDIVFSVLTEALIYERECEQFEVANRIVNRDTKRTPRANAQE